ncbi:hypothetical protein B0T20DRAFT_342699 [Sordaria brevicollis]|uniref:Uncharacterized protein n=1 Tax=Sordaria brevicollis TaxID=83679 RepID=A0AAE0PM91_SORBR|nr:hypothetical protein B0T20DRAFT_342699 [Sordaria brevicollis]
MEDNSIDTSLLASNLAVGRGVASKRSPASKQSQTLITPRILLTIISPVTHKALPAARITSVFVTFETETVTFHPGGSVVRTTTHPTVPTTLVTSGTSPISSAPSESATTSAPAPQQTGTQGPKGAVIGGAIGATLFGIFMIGVVIFCLARRRRRELRSTPYTGPSSLPARGGRTSTRSSNVGFDRLDNIQLERMTRHHQTTPDLHQVGLGARRDHPGSHSQGQMRRGHEIEVVPAGEGDRGPRLRTVVWEPPAIGPALRSGRSLLPPQRVPGEAAPAPAPAPYSSLEVPRPAPAIPAPVRPVRDWSSSVYSVPSREDVRSKFSVDSDDAADNDNGKGDENDNDSRTTVWPRPLSSSGGPAEVASPATEAGAPIPLSSTTTSHPEPEDRGGPSRQSSTYVEPPSQSRWSPDTPSSHGSEQGLTTKVQQQVAQVGAKLADTWKEKKEKLGSLLGSGSKEEKKPTREEKGKGKAKDVEIVVDPVNRGGPGWI